MIIDDYRYEGKRFFMGIRDIMFLHNENYRSERCAQSATHSLRYANYLFHSGEYICIIYLGENHTCPQFQNRSKKKLI